MLLVGMCRFTQRPDNHRAETSSGKLAFLHSSCNHTLIKSSHNISPQTEKQVRLLQEKNRVQARSFKREKDRMLEHQGALLCEVLYFTMNTVSM